jgi:pSer/pThr/pTyr-binding forkhead associated (FHA) protein
VDEATPSLYQALLLAEPRGIIVIDLDSTNGTFVNGTLVPPDSPVPLKDGDPIVLALSRRVRSP